MSKGSKTRPRFISREEYYDNWERVFGAKAQRRKHANWRRKYNRQLDKQLKENLKSYK